MLLRRRLSGLDSILGPLFETPPPTGGAPAGDPAPGSPPAPPAPPTGGAGAPPAGPPADDRSNWIPRDRFDQVNTEYQRLKKAEDDRVADETKKRGDFDALDKVQKAKIAEAEEKATRIARRAAFIAKASGKVADPEAAFKLAAADGMLNDLDVDDDGNAKDPKAVEKIVDELVKRYEFLKSTKTRTFGEPTDGNGSGQPVDASKMSARDLLRQGYADSQRR